MFILFIWQYGEISFWSPEALISKPEGNTSGNTSGIVQQPKRRDTPSSLFASSVKSISTTATSWRRKIRVGRTTVLYLLSIMIMIIYSILFEQQALFMLTKIL